MKYLVYKAIRYYEVVLVDAETRDDAISDANLGKGCIIRSRECCTPLPNDYVVVDKEDWNTTEEGWVEDVCNDRGSKEEVERSNEESPKRRTKKSV